MEKAVLAESATFANPIGELADRGIYRSRLIEADVQGSSGYYPADVIRRDGPLAFPAGTHVYLDHPTRSEEDERPERSVKEMAGILLDTATFEEGPDGRGLFARVQFFDDVKDMIKSRWQHVGLSIRASGEVEDTPEGRVVRSIREGLSVDVVTRPGAGGRLVNMAESAQTGNPPEEQTIPSTSGTGSLLNEVSAMKTAIADQLEQINLQVSALSSSVKELQSAEVVRSKDHREVKESISFLKSRQEETDRVMSESKTLDEAMVEIFKANLPMPSMIRVAKSFQPGQDLHEAIQIERDYVKKLLRESDVSKADTMLGLTESATKTELASTGTDEEYAEMSDVLSGKLF